MSTIIKLRRDALVSWSGYTLAEGEVGIVLSGSGANTKVTEFRIGDGVNTWQNLSYQNWKPSLTSIQITNGSVTKTSSISDTTASINLGDMFAVSSSKIASATASFTASSGNLTIGVKNINNDLYTASVAITKVASASVAETASILTSNTVKSVYSSSNAIYGLASWVGSNTTASVLDLNSTTSNRAVVLKNSGTGSLYIEGKASASYKAERDSNGNLITDYLRCTDTGSKTISGSINVTANISAGGLLKGTGINIGNTIQYNDDIVTQGDVVISAPVFLTDDLHVAENTYLEYLEVGGEGIESEGNISAINGSVSASSNIYAGGNVYAKGDVIAAWASDRRLKKEIKPISSPDANEVLESLRPVEFEWNEKAEELSEGHKTGKARGFLADEFLEILPNAGRKIWNEYDAVDYVQVIPYLVAGYQSLKAEVEQLKVEIAELKSR